MAIGSLNPEHHIFSVNMLKYFTAQFSIFDL